MLPSLFRTFSLASVIWVTTAAVAAAEDPAGRDLATTACAACHGANGISVSGDIPNLAGQHAQYLQTQLTSFRSGERTNALMNAVAEQLGDEEILALAEFFAALPGSEGAETSALLPAVNESRLDFPEGYPESFTYYMTIDFPAKQQTRRYFANPRPRPPHGTNGRQPRAPITWSRSTTRNSTAPASR